MRREREGGAVACRERGCSVTQAAPGVRGEWDPRGCTQGTEQNAGRARGEDPRRAPSTGQSVRRMEGNVVASIPLKT